MPAVRAVAERHGLAGARIARERLGTNAVFALGAAHVVKLSPPLWAEECAAERAALAHVAGRLSVATPEILAAGDVEGWPYLVLTRVPGVPLESAWPRLGAAARARAAERAGALAAEHRALPLPAPGVPAPDWPAFLHAQAQRAPEKLRACARLAAGAVALPAWLEPLLPQLAAGAPVFLNADLTEEHYFVSDDARGDIVGLVDFADAMIGAAEYELAPLGVFLARQAPELVASFLDGAGIARAARGLSLARRLVAFALLHRYAGLEELCDALGAGAPALEPERLARALAEHLGA